jgi:hypothetical protein
VSAREELRPAFVGPHPAGPDHRPGGGRRHQLDRTPWDYAYKAGAKDEAAIAADYAAGRLDRAGVDRRVEADFDDAVAMASYRRLAQKGVFVTPTLNISRIQAWLDTDTHANDPFLAYIGPKLRKSYDWRVQRAAKATATEIAAPPQPLHPHGQDPAVAAEAGLPSWRAPTRAS